VATSAPSYLPLAGGSLTGNLAMGGHNITGVGTVTATTFTGNLTGNVTGTATTATSAGTVSGNINHSQVTGLGSAALSNTSAFDLAGAASTALSSAETNAAATYLPLSGGTMTGELVLNSNLLVEGGIAAYTEVNLYGNGITFSDSSVQTTAGLPLTGGTMAGNIEMDGNAITDSAYGTLYDANVFGNANTTFNGILLNNPNTGLQLLLNETDALGNNSLVLAGSSLVSLSLFGNNLNMNNGSGTGGTTFNLDGSTIYGSALNSGVYGGPWHLGDGSGAYGGSLNMGGGAIYGSAGGTGQRGGTWNLGDGSGSNGGSFNMDSGTIYLNSNGTTSGYIITDNDGGINLVDQGGNVLQWNQWDDNGLSIGGNLWINGEYNVYMNNSSMTSVSAIVFADSSEQVTAYTGLQDLSSVLAYNNYAYGNSIYMNNDSGSGGGNLYMENGQIIGASAIDADNFAANSTGIGFFGASSVSQQTGTGSTATGEPGGGGTQVYSDTEFQGNGGTEYTINDIVIALKAYGLLAA
jgi:hypothetical protein